MAGKKGLMRKKKILYFARGGDISGSQRQLIYLFSRIDRLKYEPAVICTNGGQFENALNTTGVEVCSSLRLSPTRKIRYIISANLDRKRLYNYAADKNIDMIHCSYLWYSHYSLWLGKKLNCPVIIHLRTGSSVHKIKKYRLGEADRVIAISKRGYNNLLSAGIPEDKIELIYDGVNTDMFRANENAREYLKDKYNVQAASVFGLVGRIHKPSYQMEFVKSAKLYLERDRDAVFMLIGAEKDPKYCAGIRDYASRNDIADKIIFTSRSEEMHKLIGSIDVLVSFCGGSVMYEALSCGKPVVSCGFTKKGGSVHVINEYNSIVIESRKPEEAAHAMLQMRSDKEYYKKLSLNARSHALGSLSIETTVYRTFEVYDSILQKKSAAHQ
jgi:glycosyltransferase involved in cell wall biosynthesis